MQSVPHTQTRFRYNAALAIAGAIALIGAIPLLAESPLFAPILLVPLAVAVWGWRAGTDVDANGIAVRALLGTRRWRWEQVDALVPQGRRVLARLVDGGFVTLSGVAPRDLPRLVEASGRDQAH